MCVYANGKVPPFFVGFAPRLAGTQSRSLLTDLSMVVPVHLSGDLSQKEAIHTQTSCPIANIN